jgi:hypothetical protein
MAPLGAAAGEHKSKSEFGFGLADVVVRGLLGAASKRDDLPVVFDRAGFVALGGPDAAPLRELSGSLAGDEGGVDMRLGCDEDL